VPAEEDRSRAVHVTLDDSTLLRVHDALERLLDAEPDVGIRDRILLDTAVAEIAGNVLRHGETATEIVIDGQVLDDRIVVELTDDGSAVRIDLDAARAAPMPDDLVESGRGLSIAFAALDDLRYERVGPRNRWHLVRYRGARGS